MDKHLKFSVEVVREFLYLTVQIGESTHTSTIALEDIERVAAFISRWIQDRKRR